MTSHPSKPWTTSRTLACVLDDLGPYGFTKQDKRTISFQNQEVRINVDVDVNPGHRDAANTERTVYLQFWVDLLDYSLDPSPQGVRGLWHASIDRYVVFNHTGPYEQYTLDITGDYEHSRLRKDLLEFGIPLLMAFTTKESVFDRLMGVPVQLGSEKVVPFYEARHFHNAIALYLAYGLGLSGVAQKAAANLFEYAQQSTEHLQDLRRLASFKPDIATALKATAPNAYSTYVGQDNMGIRQ